VLQPNAGSQPGAEGTKHSLLKRVFIFDVSFSYRNPVSVPRNKAQQPFLCFGRGDAVRWPQPPHLSAGDSIWGTRAWQQHKVTSGGPTPLSRALLSKTACGARCFEGKMNLVCSQWNDCFVLNTAVFILEHFMKAVV